MRGDGLVLTMREDAVKTCDIDGDQALLPLPDGCVQSGIVSKLVLQYRKYINPLVLTMRRQEESVT